MKFKKLNLVSLSLAIGLAYLFSFLFNPIVHASPLTCTWTGASDTNFSTAGNWSNCNSQAPVNGSNLIFDNTSLGASASLTNDIAGLSVGSITFQGTNSSSYGFTIAGNAISVSGGITDTSSANYDNLNTDLTLTGSQSITDLTGAGTLSIGDTSYGQTLNLNGNTLTLVSSYTGPTGIITINSQLSGSGNLIMNGQNSGVYNFATSASGFSGSVVIDNGVANIFSTSAFGTASVTVQSGASLSGSFPGTANTFSNPITVGGSGNNATGALILSDDCPPASGNGTCNNDGTITLAGLITLTANTTIGTDATVNITGKVSGNYTITLSPNYTGTLQGNGVSGVGTPDTGVAGISSDPIKIMAVTTLAALSLIFVAYLVRSKSHS